MLHREEHEKEHDSSRKRRDKNSPAPPRGSTYMATLAKMHQDLASRERKAMRLANKMYFKLTRQGDCYSPLPDGGPIRSGATGKPDVGRGGRRTRNVEAPGLPQWLRLRCRITVESIRLRVDVTSRDVGIQRERAPAIGQGSCFLLACLGFAGFHAVHCLLGRCLGLKLSHHFHARCQ